MREWARRFAQESRAKSEAVLRNRPGAGSGGFGGPPKNFYRYTGTFTAIALVSLQATYSAIGAAANVAGGARSDPGSEQYFAESAMINYGNGELAYGDLDAIEAGIQMGGGEVDASTVAWLTYAEAGEMFQ